MSIIRRALSDGKENEKEIGEDVWCSVRGERLRDDEACEAVNNSLANLALDAAPQQAVADGDYGDLAWD